MSVDSQQYRRNLKELLETCCETVVTIQQLKGFSDNLERKGICMNDGEAYFKAEAQILKVCFGCVEKDIRKAQQKALELSEV